MPKTSWILIKKAVPKTSDPVKVKTVDGKEHVGWYVDRYGNWHTERYRPADIEVKAWVPLEDSEKAREEQVYVFPKIPLDTEEQVASHQPEDCGVYVLFSEGEIVYVGQSKHMHQRVNEHQERHDVDFDSKVFFETDDRFRLEAFLIQLLNPIYNEMSSNGTDWR